MDCQEPSARRRVADRTADIRLVQPVFDLDMWFTRAESSQYEYRFHHCRQGQSRQPVA